MIVTDFSHLREQAEQLRTEGQEDEALALLQRAYLQLQANPTNTPDRWLQQAWVAMELGRIDDAVQAAQTCLSLEPEHAQALTLLTHGLLRQNQPSEVARVLESARGAAETNPNIDYNLASAYLLLEEYEKAVQVAQRGHRQHPDFHPMLKVLFTGLTYLDRDEEALDIAQTAASVEPTERWAWEIYCAALYNLDCISDLCRALPHYLQADPIDRNTLSWLQQFQGSAVADALMSHCRTLYQKGSLTIAADLAKVAQDIVERADDALQLQRGSLLRAAAHHYLRVDRYQQALQAIEQSYQCMESLQPDWPEERLNTLVTWAQVLRRLDRLSEAEDLVRRALSQWTTRLEDAVDRATTIHVLGDILRQKAELEGEHDALAEAEERLTEALELRQHLLSSSHIDLADSLHGLALLRRAQGRYDAQQRLLNDASQIAKAALGPEHPYIASLALDLAICALEEGQPTDARNHCRNAHAILRQALEEESPMMGLVLLLQSAVFRVLGQLNKAYDALEQGTTILEQTVSDVLPVRIRRLQQNDLFAQSINAFLSLQHELAYVALYDKNYSRAAHHLGLALRADPQHEKNLDLLDTLCERLPDRNALLPEPPQEPDASLLAIQAHYALRTGHVNDAFSELYSLHEILPNAGFDRWAMRWLEDEGIVRSMHVEWVLPFLASILNQFPGRIVETKAQDELRGFLPAINMLIHVYPEHPDVASLASSFFRKQGDLEQALQLAQRACQKEPSWRSVVVLALCYETMKEWDKAISTYEVALMDCPDPAPVALDLGDLYRRLEEWDQAAETYLSVLENEPYHEKAYPCYLLCRAQGNPTLQTQQEWSDYLQQHTHNPWLQQLKHEHGQAGSLPGIPAHQEA
ncbi:MAG: tetratricopeptide repeat protein [Deltaproteobacteria bacterium]|nr:MAG: tetratricopeptide repeat protein [Deltaproteobacteria bacterium]